MRDEEKVLRRQGISPVDEGGGSARGATVSSDRRLSISAEIS